MPPHGRPYDATGARLVVGRTSAARAPSALSRPAAPEYLHHRVDVTLHDPLVSRRCARQMFEVLMVPIYLHRAAEEHVAKQRRIDVLRQGALFLQVSHVRLKQLKACGI